MDNNKNLEEIKKISQAFIGINITIKGPIKHSLDLISGNIEKISKDLNKLISAQIMEEREVVNE